MKKKETTNNFNPLTAQGAKLIQAAAKEHRVTPAFTFNICGQTFYAKPRKTDDEEIYRYTTRTILDGQIDLEFEPGRIAVSYRGRSKAREGRFYCGISILIDWVEAILIDEEIMQNKGLNRR